MIVLLIEMGVGLFRHLIALQAPHVLPTYLHLLTTPHMPHIPLPIVPISALYLVLVLSPRIP